MAIAIDAVTDVVNSTITRYGRKFLTDAATELQNYVAGERLINKNRLMRDSQGGSSYTFDVLYQGDGNAKAIGLFEVDNLDQVDGTIQGTVPWRYIETGCHFDVKQLNVNMGAEKIFDFVKTKEYQMWISYWELVERYFWDGPASSADTKIPFGLLNYWLDYDATEGFNGGNHANFSSGPAGIDTSISSGSKYKHYTANYSAVTDADLLRKMRNAVRYTNFKGISNKPIKSYGDGVGHRWGIYTTGDNLGLLEELLDSKNDNVGTSLNKYDGTTMFERVPVEWVPYLQENHATSDPVIGLDWNCIGSVAPKGEWMRQTPYKVASNQHEVRERFVNSSFQVVMQSRRQHFMIAKSDPMDD
jgi:hypothetical protein